MGVFKQLIKSTYVLETDEEVGEDNQVRVYLNNRSTPKFTYFLETNGMK